MQLKPEEVPDERNIESEFSKAELCGQVSKALGILSDRDAGILCLCYGLGGVQAEPIESIALLQGISPFEVEQLRLRALDRLQRGAKVGTMLRPFLEDVGILS